MYTAEASDPRDDYASAGAGVPADVAEFLSPFSQSFDARHGLGLFTPASAVTHAVPIAETDDQFGLGFTIPILGIDTDDIVDAWNVGTQVFGGGGGAAPTDPGSAIWKNVKPSDVLTLATLRVQVRPDGWYDVGGTKLSQEESDFRSGGLMARMIGAQMPGATMAWLDERTGAPLSSAEAWNRWMTRYGAGATMESVLRQSGVTIDAGGVEVEDPAPSYAVTYTPAQPAGPSYPVTYPGPQPGTSFVPPRPGTQASPTPAQTAAGIGLSKNAMLIGGAALAIAAVAYAASRGRGR